MEAAWYESQGPPFDVLHVGEITTPEPEPGEVRIRVSASGINPGDVKKRQDTFGAGMPYARVIPHSDGAGVIDAVGSRIPSSRIGERVWCFGAQSYRPFGTAAEYVAVPSEQAVPLPNDVSFEQGACLGIPGITAHRAVHAGGTVDGRVVLVQGGAGAVGQCAVALARHAGAQVIATVRSKRDVSVAQGAGAHRVIENGGLSNEELLASLRALAPDGVDHIVEVAFHPNMPLNVQFLRQSGSVATYATGDPTPAIPFWPLVFKNVSIFFLGSDDFPAEAKLAGARALNEILQGEWPGFEIEFRFPLRGIAQAHEAVEQRRLSGRVVLNIQDVGPE